mmetsp:Transcript_15858/g.55193  ORF Transcript_15858/g.55193 Transcript_15858/m.55193 type:complete len:900 (-) Transcript_15858:218-2917(-)
MKYGKRLRFLSVFPWISHYIDYKRLKRLVKATAAEVARDRHGVAARKYCEAFEHAFIEELERVNDFFCLKAEELGDLARKLAERSSDYILSATSNTEGLAALESALTATARSLARVQEFVDVNLQGFRKAAKKFEKKTRLGRYDQLMLGILPRFDFATSTAVAEAMSVVEASRTELLAFRDTIDTSAMPRVPSTSLEERLKVAIRHSNASRIEYLLRSSTPPRELLNTCGAALVHVLCSAGANAAVTRLLDAGVDVDAPDVCDRTPLAKAILAGQTLTVSMLLSRGAAIEPRFRNFSGASMLHFAVQGGSTETLAVLLARMRETGQLAASLRARDDDGFSALYHASISDAKEPCLRLLVDAARSVMPDEGVVSGDAGSGFSGGGEVDPSPSPSSSAPDVGDSTGAAFLGHNFDGVFVWTCLNAAAYRGALKCTKLLLAAGSDTSQRVAASASTALHSAARGGHAAIVAALVDAGADVTALNAYAETPMHLACQGAQAACLQIMLRKAPAWSLRAQVPDPIPASEPPHPTSAAWHDSDDDAAAPVRDAASPSPASAYAVLPRMRSSSWVPLLHQAVLTEDEACVRVLLDAGADPMREDTNGWSAYALALYIGHNHRIAPVLKAAAPAAAAAAAAAGGGDGGGGGKDGDDDAPRIENFSVSVLKVGYWPTFLDVAVTPPETVAAATRHFAAYYARKESKKRLTWVYTQGNATMRATFDGGAWKQLNVTTLQMCVLLAFNSRSSWTLRDLCAATGMDSEVLKRVAHPLHVKASGSSGGKKKKSQNVLDKVGGGGGSGGDVFKVNESLAKHPSRRLAYPAPTLAPSKARERVDVDRRFCIDAAVVRIMKARRTLAHGELMSEVLAQLTSFRAAPKQIKERIEDLIHRDYLARTDTAAVYTYLA